MKILKIRFSYLRNEAHLQFLLLVKKLLNGYSAVAAIVTELITPFFELISLESTLVDAVRASEYTEELVEADRRVDRDIVGINSAIESALHHYDEKVVKDAKILELRMKGFRGEIEKKSYEEESAAVKILVNDLLTTYSPQVATLGIGGWVGEINLAQAEFEQLFILRNAQIAARPKQKLREVRKEVEAVYRQIVERIEAYCVINGDKDCSGFIDELNGEIVYFNEHSHHQRRVDIKNAVVSSIVDQPYQGEPVIVLPDVYYEGKKLVFTKEYELSYKHNTHPGTATITIHGKGAFYGQTIITFNIIEIPKA
ncbi:MAG: DUF6261 family protein [Tannerella sp.]|jgi:hypothetical protein|nr:DUF6261 family protein [Tannerella sp.]